MWVWVYGFDKEKVPDNSHRVAEVILAAESFGRPIFAGPGMPANRLKLLRDAFEKIHEDPAYLAEAEKRKLEIDFETGSELEASAKEVIAASPEVIERMKKLLGN